MEYPESSQKLVANVVFLNVLALLLANFLTIYFFISQNASVWQILLTYFFQTVIIMVFYYRRIASVNISQVVSDYGHLSPLHQWYLFYRSTQREQFLYLFILCAPLAVVSWFVLYKYAGQPFFGVMPFPDAQINYLYVALPTMLFFVHHLVSWGVEMYAYRHGDTDRLSIPYPKLAVRVFTMLAIIFFLPFAYIEVNSLQLFYTFIALKTILDVTLSNSTVLLNDLWIGRAR